MGDLHDFAKRIRLVGKAIPENADRLVRATVLAIDANVVRQTPVDTGRARANWQVGIGGAKGEELPAPASPGEGAERALASARGVMANYRGQGEAHISNNLPYIRPLNDGHSSQAPAGFVETAVVIGTEQVRNAKLVSGEGIDVEVVETGAAAGAGSAPGKHRKE